MGMNRGRGGGVYANIYMRMPHTIIGELAVAYTLVDFVTAVTHLE